MQLLAERLNVHFLYSYIPEHLFPGIDTGNFDLLLGTLCPVPEKKTSPHTDIIYLEPLDSTPVTKEELFQDLRHMTTQEQKNCNFSIPFLWQSTITFRAPGTPESLKNHRCAVIPGTPEEKFLMSLNLQTPLLRVSNAEEGFRLLKNNVCDLFAVETALGQFTKKNTPDLKNIVASHLPLQSYERGLIILNGNLELAEKISGALKEIKQSGAYTAIQNRWVGPYLQPGVSKSTFAKVLIISGALIVLILLWNYELKRKIALNLKQRKQVLDFVRDGIIVTDRSGNIAILNSSAKKILDLNDDALGKKADLLIKNLDVETVITSAKPVYNLEQTLRGVNVMSNKIPLLSHGLKNYGVIVTIRDMSELQAMAEEMTGVKMYVESLRIHNHEFMNTLQAISGLIQLGKYDQAVEYIATETNSSSSAHSFMAERIKNAAVCGVLMGKAGRCKELGIDFNLAPDSFCDNHSNEISDRMLVIIVGNLLQNAIEALDRRSNGTAPRINFAIYDESGYIFISVRDNAGLMTDEIAASMFNKGFSTKNRLRLSGFGLYSMHSITETLGGEIDVDYIPGEFTEFSVSIPLPKKDT